MTRQEIRDELHKVLDSHDGLLDAIRSSTAALRQAFDAHDQAVSDAIAANRTAVRLLNRLEREGVSDS